jgi:acyl-CoA dehydrogenase
MNFGLTEEQDMIVNTVRSFVENEIYPHEDLVERTGSVPPEIADRIKQKTIDLGFYACNFPQSVGGAGLSHVEFALVERELGRGSMALNHFFGRPQNILMACQGDQIERYLLPAVRGEKMDALAMTEPNAGDLMCAACSVMLCAMAGIGF